MTLLSTALALLLALPVSAPDLSLRYRLTEKALELNVIYGVDSPGVLLVAGMESDWMTRDSAIVLAEDPSRQHLFIWRRPPAGEYVLFAIVLDQDGNTVAQTFTRVFVS